MRSFNTGPSVSTRRQLMYEKPEARRETTFKAPLMKVPSQRNIPNDRRLTGIPMSSYASQPRTSSPTSSNYSTRTTTLRSMNTSSLAATSPFRSTNPSQEVRFSCNKQFLFLIFRANPKKFFAMNWLVCALLLMFTAKIAMPKFNQSWPQTHHLWKISANWRLSWIQWLANLWDVKSFQSALFRQNLHQQSKHVRTTCWMSWAKSFCNALNSKKKSSKWLKNASMRSAKTNVWLMNWSSRQSKLLQCTGNSHSTTRTSRKMHHQGKL